MKNIIRPAITISAGLFLALACAGISATLPSGNNGLTKAFFFQSTATPPAQQVSIIGSTDWIVVMGVVVIIIIIIPILLRYKSWMRRQ